jgi:glycosyltransferase involved in cell wall biosynthesis
MVTSKQGEANVLILCLKKAVAKTATPSKLTAYMLSGRPIIASVDVDSDCADIIRNANCGIVVEPDDPNALAMAISEMAGKDITQLNEMGNSAYEYAKNYLSKDKNLKIIIDKLIGEINYKLI